MKTYDFHGSIPISEIDNRLFDVWVREVNAFKILTGYGSMSGVSKSKAAVLKSLSNMKKRGWIKDYFSGDVLARLQTSANSYEYQVKLKYYQKLKNDRDFGNDGIIFVFKK